MSHVEAAVTHCFVAEVQFFNDFLRNTERKRKVMKDKKHHGTVDESSLEQQFQQNTGRFENIIFNTVYR